MLAICSPSRYSPDGSCWDNNSGRGFAQKLGYRIGSTKLLYQFIIWIEVLIQHRDKYNKSLSFFVGGKSRCWSKEVVGGDSGLGDESSDGLKYQERKLPLEMTVESSGPSICLTVPSFEPSSYQRVNNIILVSVICHLVEVSVGCLFGQQIASDSMVMVSLSFGLHHTHVMSSMIQCLMLSLRVFNLDLQLSLSIGDLHLAIKASRRAWY
ncbi:hypothetical protein Tco_0970023 [Tanacetum coccineum]